MLALLLVIAVFVIAGYKVYKSILSPLFMFNMIWLVTLLLYQMKWSEIQQDLNDKCILCIWCAVVSYNLAGLLSKGFSNVKFKKLFDTVILTRYISFEEKTRYINAFITIMLIVEGVYSKGYPLVWILLGNGKSYKDFGIPSVTGALYGLIICMGAYTLFKKSRLKYFYLLIGVLVVSRQIIMSIVIEGIIVYYFENGKKFENIDRKKVILLAVAAFVFFGIYGNLRTGKEAFNMVFEAREPYRNVSSIFKWAYAYLCFAINNFNNLVLMTEGGVNGGASMLNELLPTVLLERFGFTDLYSPNYLVKINFTTSTYLPPIYLDFGLTGIILFNFIIGLWGGQLYRKHRENPYTKNRMKYAIYIHNILLLLFSNFFLYLPIMIQYVYILLIFNDTEDVREVKGADVKR